MAKAKNGLRLSLLGRKQKQKQKLVELELELELELEFRAWR